MARVPLVQDDDEAARATGVFDTFKDEGRPPSDIFRALAGSAYEWSHHRPMALAAGVTADQAAALAAWRSSSAFGPTERLVLTATEAVHDMAVTGELFGELEAALGQPGAIELIVVVSQYEAVARIIQALGVEVEADHEQHLADWVEIVR